MDDPKPAVRIYLTLAGIEYEIVRPERMIWPELKEAKRVSGGLSGLELEQGIRKFDPDAWLALLYISIRRVNPTVKIDDVERLLSDMPLTDIVEGLRDEIAEAELPNPPISPPVGGSQKNDADSGATTPPPSILETSGIQG